MFKEVDKHSMATYGGMHVVIMLASSTQGRGRFLSALPHLSSPRWPPRLHPIAPPHPPLVHHQCDSGCGLSGIRGTGTAPRV